MIVLIEAKAMIFTAGGSMVTEQENIHNLFKKRIQKILEKCLSIDEEYHLTLRNTETKNAEN